MRASNYLAVVVSGLLASACMPDSWVHHRWMVHGPDYEFEIEGKKMAATVLEKSGYYDMQINHQTSFIGQTLDAMSRYKATAALAMKEVCKDRQPAVDVVNETYQVWRFKCSG